MKTELHIYEINGPDGERLRVVSEAAYLDLKERLRALENLVENSHENLPDKP